MTTSMTTRIDYARVAPAAVRAVYGVEQYVRQSGLEHSLLHLMKLRASYMNGCAYCVDMHTKDALAEGETVQRLLAVPVWRETPFFSPRERAALAFTEALTDMRHGGASDELFSATREHFSDEEIVNLAMAAVAINSWNRLAVTFHAEVGSYQPRRELAAQLA
jgi:AhpD family alkylhydroperoxidase